VNSIIPVIWLDVWKNIDTSVADYTTKLSEDCMAIIADCIGRAKETE